MALYNISQCLFSLSFVFLVLSLQTLFSFCGALDSEAGNETPFASGEGAGKGRKKLGQIDKACDGGKMLSPIDLVDESVQVTPELGKLQRDYQPAPATVKNSGLGITVTWKGDAGKININGTYYNLTECHWRSPAEHKFNGTRNDLELQVVHQSSNGSFAVIGITYIDGHPDPFLTKVLRYISPTGQEDSDLEMPNLGDMESGSRKSTTSEEIDLGIMNPGIIKFGSRKYYRYIGSLTVPPCTEGVVWTIVKKVRTASRDQIRAIREAVSNGAEANATPIQPLEGRSIQLYRPTTDDDSS